LIERISSFQATRLEWKSIECGIWFSSGFTSVIRTRSPTFTRRTGPGTVSPKVQTFWTKPRRDGHQALGHDELDLVDLAPCRAAWRRRRRPAPDAGG
jgi:hypothetical protein